MSECDGDITDKRRPTAVSGSTAVQAGLVARGVLGRSRGAVEEFLRLVGLEAFAEQYLAPQERSTGAGP
jgi:hypothetical protein